MKQSISKKLRKSVKKQRRSNKRQSIVKRQTQRKSVKKQSNKKHTRVRHTRVRHTRVRHTRVNNRRLRLYKKGGGIIPSSVSQLGYSVMGSGQSIVDGWNGKPSSFAYVNPSPEHQIPANNGYYTGNHGVV
jgi:hypothetical protein